MVQKALIVCRDVQKLTWQFHSDWFPNRRRTWHVTCHRELSLSLITGSTCTIDCRSDLGCVTFSSFFLRFFLFMFFSTYTNDTICKLWMKFLVYRWWTYSFLFKSEDTKHLVQNYSGWVDFLRAITELLEYILRSCISSRFKLDLRR